MKCCESCIYGECTNDICCTRIGSKYTAKSVEKQSKNTSKVIEIETVPLDKAMKTINDYFNVEV